MFTYQIKYWIILVAKIRLNSRFSAVPPWFAITNLLNNLYEKTKKACSSQLHVQRTQQNHAKNLASFGSPKSVPTFLNNISISLPQLAACQGHRITSLTCFRGNFTCHQLPEFQVASLKKKRDVRGGGGGTYSTNVLKIRNTQVKLKKSGIQQQRMTGQASAKWKESPNISGT